LKDSNPFKIGDIVFMRQAGLKSMIYYAEKGRKWECPCTWHGITAPITNIQGDFCTLEPETGRTSVFHRSDLARSIQESPTRPEEVFSCEDPD